MAHDLLIKNQQADFAPDLMAAKRCSKHRLRERILLSAAK